MLGTLTLVCWIKDVPKTWSVVSSDVLEDGTKRKSKSLVGKVVNVQWKSKIHPAEVVAAGEDEDVLNCQAHELAKQEFEKPDAEPVRKYSKLSTVKTASTSKNHQSASVSANKKFGKRSTLCERSQQISSVLEVLELDEETEQIPTPIVNDPGVIPDRSNNLKEDETNWKELYESSRSDFKDLRKKYKDLKRAHKLCSSDEAVELLAGSGIKLLQSEVAAMNTMSPSITFFARNLFRRVFKSEVVNHSLLGRKSTALVDHNPLPAVDVKRRDAVIEFSLSTYGFPKSSTEEQRLDKNQKKTRKAPKSRIIKSLSDFVREENVKFKRA
ncbi:unnamed protein product [Allacma fusca]|uniref:BEN domain-containing protein n=1 Tax=Allacma fusca TaxID=39272 RepID=A0A8J2NZH4_9HEXA|nr:unnamed protein product [Allacma fusca]